MATEPATPSAPRRSRSPEVHEVRFVAYPKLLFTWPLILAGIVFWFIAGGLNEQGLGTLGWIYLFVMTLVLMTLGVDVGRNQAAFWVILIFALAILGRWLADVKGITIVGNIYRWFQGLNVQYDAGFGLALSLILAVPFAVMLFWARINDLWRITHNEFEHYAFGKSDDSLGRGAKTIRTDYPDVLELLLGMAGTLIVFNATGTAELRRIPHVMFLPLVRKRLNLILERTAVTASLVEEEEDDDV